MALGSHLCFAAANPAALIRVFLDAPYIVLVWRLLAIEELTLRAFSVSLVRRTLAEVELRT